MEIKKDFYCWEIRRNSVISSLLHPQSVRMITTFKQYRPADIFLNLKEPESLEAENLYESPTTGFCPTGCVFLDTLVQNLHQRGLHNGKYHAKLLGVTQTDMSVTVYTLTGMKYSEFAEAYILLMAIELYKTKKKHDLASSKRLGFGSYSGYYRFMVRNKRF